MKNTLIRSMGWISSWRSHQLSSIQSVQKSVRQGSTVTILPIQSKDHEEILDFLRKHFWPEEPLTVGSEPKMQDPADEEYTMAYIEYGLSVMATETNDSSNKEKSNENIRGKLVGAIIAGPKYPDCAKTLFEEAAKVGPTKWGHTLQLLGCLERDANVFERYKVEKTLHAQVMAVSAEARGRGIGTRLIKEIISMGRTCGYPLFTTDCTSKYSALQCTKLGMDCVNSMEFEEYVGNDGVPIFKPPEPHFHILTFAMRL